MKAKIIILAPILIALFSSKAIATCYRIDDPDGWTNARDVTTGSVIGTIPSGAYIYSSQNQGDYAILSSAPSLMVYRYYLTGQDSRSCRLSAFTVTSSDGYSNVRTGPNGSILTTVDYGEIVVLVGVHPDSNEWLKIVTYSGVIGYIHYSQITANN